MTRFFYTNSTRSGKKIIKSLPAFILGVGPADKADDVVVLVAHVVVGFLRVKVQFRVGVLNYSGVRLMRIFGYCELLKSQ